MIRMRRMTTGEIPLPTINLEEYVKLKGDDPTRLLLERKTELGKCPKTLRLAMMYFTGI